MAFEDAVVLALCSRDSDSVENAFEGYERQRRERVERIVAQGKKTGDGKTPTALVRILRDIALRWVFRQSRLTRSDPFKWIFDFGIEWNRSPAEGPGDSPVS